MSFLNELINSVTDDELREQLHERMGWLGESNKWEGK